MMVLATLCCFAFLAGFIDGMVGGGGLIQLPAFFILMPELSLAQTLATNKTAGFMGTLVATSRYVKKVSIDWRELLPMIIAAGIAAFGGALLVSYLHKEQFMPFIIIVLIVVLVYTLLNRQLGLEHQHKNRSAHKHLFYSIVFGAGIGVYDGVIGPGTGSFLIFGFIMIFGFDFLRASANAKVINCVTNFAALSLFLLRGKIIFSIAVPVGIANLSGNYVGASLALKKGSAFIRVFFMLMVVALIVRLGWDYRINL